MRRLILMRHAKSSWDNLQLADHDRPLNKRGRASAKAMGDWLRRRNYLPDMVLCSSAERTGETFLRLGLDAPVTYLQALYHAGPETMLKHLQTANGNVVLMVGHNPGIASFATMLLNELPTHERFHDFPTGATLVADFSSNWGQTAWKTGRCVEFAVPREVMADDL